MAAPPSSAPEILLLKTPSTPTDAYGPLFATRGFSPLYIPVLSHTFSAAGLDRLRSVLAKPETRSEFGGLIFTSQRAVEGFLDLFGHASNAPGAASEHGLDKQDLPRLGVPPDWPVYVVGPATYTALTTTPSSPLRMSAERVLGKETGNGDVLAEYIVQDYLPRCSSSATDLAKSSVKRLLFLVGEKRRDIIPNRLDKAGIPHEDLELYATTENAEFPAAIQRELSRLLPTLTLQTEDALQIQAKSKERRQIWIVVFSPQGCGAMLQAVQDLEKQQHPEQASDGVTRTERRVFIATIGPTTAAEVRRLQLEMNPEGEAAGPDVVAAKPTPQALLDGILAFEAELDGVKA
jgi:uroporphyrinogen-III synthase